MELEKQAELYEKNAQSDIVKEIFTQMLKGDNPFENLAVGLNEFERIKKLKWHQIKVKVMVSINVILNEEKKALRCLMLKKQVTSAHRILSFPCLPPVLS